MARTPYAWLGQLSILAALVLLAVSVNSSSSPDGPLVSAEPPPPSEGPLTVSQIALTTEQEEALFSDLTPYRYLVVRDSLSPRLEELRAVHPESQILLYKDVSFTVADPSCEFDPFQGGGVSDCQARENESWYLHAADGARLASADFPALSAMNIANDGYRQAWLESVLERLGDAVGDGSEERFDGVWMDDTNLNPGHGLEGVIAELSDDEYRHATVEFVEEVAPRLQAEGFAAVLNLGMQSGDPAQRESAIRLAHSASMVNREQFVRVGEGPALFSAGGDEAQLWDEEVSLMEDIQAAGSDFHAIAYGMAGDLQAQLYARATFLLGWEGQDGSALNYRTTDTVAPASAWTESLGLPTADRVRVGAGWMREFTEGFVLVNPSPDKVQAFDLVDPHAGMSASCATQIEVPPVMARMVRPC